LGKNIQIKETIGKGLVELIETGKIDSVEMTSLLSLYLTPMTASNIDSLVLGCTHYPYLIPKIRTILGSKIKIIDSGEAVAKQTRTVLTTHNLLNMNAVGKALHTLYINKNKSVLENLLSDTKDHNLNIIKRDF
jgi:glutamate racemase